MSDPVSNVEIEDVLSSIRRLVSEEARVPPRSAAANATLILTPDTRVSEAAPEAPDDALSSEIAAPEDMLADAEETADTRGTDPVTDDVPNEDLADGEVPSEAASNQSDDLGSVEDMDAPADTTLPPFASGRGNRGARWADQSSLERALTEIETAVTETQQDWEPDTDDTKLSHENAPHPQDPPVTFAHSETSTQVQDLLDDAAEDAALAALAEEMEAHWQASPPPRLLKQDDAPAPSAPEAAVDDGSSGQPVDAVSETEVVEELPEPEVSAVADDPAKEEVLPPLDDGEASIPEHENNGIEGTSSEDAISDEALMATAEPEPSFQEVAEHAAQSELVASDHVVANPIPESHESDLDATPEASIDEALQQDQQVHNHDEDTSVEAVADEEGVSDPEDDRDVLHELVAQGVIELEAVGPATLLTDAPAPGRFAPSDDVEEQASKSDASSAPEAEPTPEIDLKTDHVSGAPREPVKASEEAPIAATAEDARPDPLVEVTEEIDEEALRELVVSIIRQELQGPLGERITRNVRKLVRREIARISEAGHID